LLRVEALPLRIWEPCCGPNDRTGAVLRAHGHEVVSHDLVTDRIDFLLERRAPDGVGAIVTNPPYKLAAQFIRHGLALGVPMAAMLLRLNFLESASRSDLIDGGRLARVHVFRDRLPRMHRQDWEGPRASSATAYGWLVWLSRHSGPTVLDRITCRRRAP
jgi:hypothetical protein